MSNNKRNVENINQKHLEIFHKFNLHVYEEALSLIDKQLVYLKLADVVIYVPYIFQFLYIKHLSKDQLEQETYNLN